MLVNGSTTTLEVEPAVPVVDATTVPPLLSVAVNDVGVGVPERVTS